MLVSESSAMHQLRRRLAQKPQLDLIADRMPLGSIQSFPKRPKSVRIIPFACSLYGSVPKAVACRSSLPKLRIMWPLPPKGDCRKIVDWKQNDNRGTLDSAKSGFVSPLK